MKRIFLVALLPALLLLLNALPSHAGRVLTDQVGRKVMLPDAPARVVSLAPSITEIIFALGKGDLLKGATMYSNYPEEASALPKVGSYVRLDLEKIIALKPDLCIAVKDGNPKKAADRLEALGIPVYAVNPVDLASVMNALGELGDVLGAEQRAGELVGEMNRRISAVEKAVQKSPDRPRVFFQIGVTPIVSVGTGTFLNDLIERAGGTNVCAGHTAYPRFSREKVLALSPEVMIITTMSRSEQFERVKAAWESWPSLPAARNGRIHLVDSNIFDRPTPRMLDALELLLTLFHPELSKGDDNG